LKCSQCKYAALCLGRPGRLPGVHDYSMAQCVRCKRIWAITQRWSNNENYLHSLTVISIFHKVPRLAIGTVSPECPACKGGTPKGGRAGSFWLLFAALVPGCHELYVTNEPDSSHVSYRIYGIKKRRKEVT